MEAQAGLSLLWRDVFRRQAVQAKPSRQSSGSPPASQCAACPARGPQHPTHAAPLAPAHHCGRCHCVAAHAGTCRKPCHGCTRPPPAGRILNVTVCPADTNEPPRLLNYMTAPNVRACVRLCTCRCSRCASAGARQAAPQRHSLAAPLPHRSRSRLLGRSWRTARVHLCAYGACHTFAHARAAGCPPQVLVWSGVAASSSFPGLYPPQFLVGRNSKGQICRRVHAGAPPAAARTLGCPPAQRAARAWRLVRGACAHQTLH